MNSGAHPPSPQFCVYLCGVLAAWMAVRITVLFLARQEVEEIPCRLHIQDAPSSYYGGS